MYTELQNSTNADYLSPVSLEASSVAFPKFVWVQNVCRASLPYIQSGYISTAYVNELCSARCIYRNGLMML